ncbi:MAG: ATP-binding cassette domain-containing protein [Bacteroidales bacterium]|nr:ATP-binding cassette domain-containing protein [Bacteroidales bacterium]
MSEEILKALMRLFAIIAKQDDGVEKNEIEFVKNFLKSQLNDEVVKEFIALFYKHADIEDINLYLKELKEEEDSDEKKKRKLTSVKDSVRILGICKKINKKLTQQQKVVVLVRLFELVNTDKKFTEQRMAIINTVAEVFNISTKEFKSTETFIIKNEFKELDVQSILIVNHQENLCEHCKHITTEELDGSIFILHVQSVDLYFLRYTGNQDIFLNGQGVNNRNIYLFAKGSTIKLPKGKPIYYSDVVSHYLADTTLSKISYNVNNVEFTFPNGGIGLRDINLSEEHGKLVGIMGASGAGKTTLLNVLTGNEAPSNGEVLINGVNLHTEKEKIEGVIGYIPQDDLLIEELTVFQNLYYNAKLCFDKITEEEITNLVNKTLSNLGLLEKKELKVGSPLNKTISGGQRKRLNIALELIREPSILFVDEPTSGLSSRDSENVMDLLRELALKGKLIFVVIHQPSSDIYKMFDKMIILDTGGYLIYYGNPVEAVSYFKRIDAQVNSEVGECPTCGNVNPELIFNIVDAKVVDEFGKYTNHRKVSPLQWEEHYDKNIEKDVHKDVNEEPPKSLNIPKWFKQFKIYTIRDFLSKASNKQYIAINFLEAPLLAFILASIIRYIADPNSRIYIFRENENIPPYVFMALIVALFLGFMVAAEEIFRDRKILKREAFLNLSRSSYLVSKILILFVISAIQSYLFVIVGSLILGIKGLDLYYWMALFTTSTFANMLSLNISSAFNSAVTIYILIPLLIIPQMALGGAMFSFDKLNKMIGSVDKVPLVAEFITARWTYEALLVKHFKDNEFEKDFYELEKQISISDFKQVYYLPELTEKVDKIISRLNSKDEEIIETTKNDFKLLRNELSKEIKRVPEIKFELINQLYIDSFSNFVQYNTNDYIEQLTSYYANKFSEADYKKEKIIEYLDNTHPGYYNSKRAKYHNEAVTDIVKKVYEKNKIVEYKNNLIQHVDPIFQDPEASSFLNFRCHFYAPRKQIFGKYFDTFWFNIVIVWMLTIILYITLYYNHLKKALNFFEK